MVLLCLCVALIVAAGCNKDDPPNGPTPETGIDFPNGFYYTGVMGTDSLTPVWQFAVRDSKGQRMKNYAAGFVELSGDGSISFDTVRTDGTTGLGENSFDFSGLFGHADIQVVAAGDTAIAHLRASTILPGSDTGQAQYMMLGDTYKTLVEINGEPEAVVSSEEYYILYAEYEKTLGVVLVIEDDTQHGDTGTVQDFEQIFAIIVNDTGNGTPGVTGYLGKTADSIGIGSGIDTIRAVYGEPDEIELDDDDPPAIAIRYYDQGLLFYADLIDTVAFEIHLRAPTGDGLPPVLAEKRGTTATRSTHTNYHRFRSTRKVSPETE